MTARERLQRYRNSGGAADLVRVEVLVPPDGAGEIKALARRLRAEHRSSAALKPLFEEAVGRYGATCLWNCRPAPTLEGMALIERRLRQHGDMGAWRLAAAIREALGHAA